jgi:hypothetical protein
MTDDAITVRFTGICTHVLSGLGSAQSRHRTVLVRAEKDTAIWDKKIPPHIPRLRIDKDDIVPGGIEGPLDGLTLLEPEVWVWQFAGAALALEGLASQPYESDVDIVPHLRSRGGKLDPVNDDVVVHEQAAGYFDIDRGVMTAKTMLTGAVITELTAKIGATPKLKVTSFGSHVSSWITLRPGAVIHIEHTGTVAGDSPYDFLLHYLIFPRIPDDVEIPEHEVEEKKKLKAMAKDDNNISAGCSNSVYP